jgi:hypothetical protein
MTTCATHKSDTYTAFLISRFHRMQVDKIPKKKEVVVPKVRIEIK